MEKYTVQDVANVLHMAPQTVRVYAQYKLFPFMRAVKLPGSSHYHYVVLPALFEAYVTGGGKPDVSKLMEGVKQWQT